MQGSKRPLAARTRLGLTSRTVFLALALVLGGSANAADLSMPFKAPPPSPAFSWTGFFDPPGAGDTRMDWQGSFRGRAGFAVSKALIYGTGGIAFGNISHTYTNLITGISETTPNIRAGWTAGGGVEVALTPNILARVEYRYTDFGTYRYASVTAFPGLTGQQ